MTQFTLDEFIEFFEREAKDYKNKNIEVMAKDYQNLTEWLRELKAYRENSCKDAISREQVLSIASMYMCALNHVLLTLENLPFQENKGETMLNRNAVMRIAATNARRFDKTYTTLKNLPPIRTRQSTRKTVRYSHFCYFDGEPGYSVANCPNCNLAYDIFDKNWRMPFCPRCGTELSWEVEEWAKR